MKSMFGNKTKTSTATAAGTQIANEQIEPGAIPAVPNGLQTIEVDDTPPDGGYGWVVVFAVALLNGFTWGIAAVSAQCR